MAEAIELNLPLGEGGTDSVEKIIKPLLDLCCAKIASMIKGKSPEEIRETFGIENDFTPEEEARLREEHKWCDDIS